MDCSASAPGQGSAASIADISQGSRQIPLILRMQFSASGRHRYNAFCRSVFSPIYPVGACWQVLGRGLVPRLSIGTLQLSIRCSSIHFLPSRSLPVSGAGEFEGRVAAPDVVAGSRSLS
jgi:hypothetical protein